jgi:heme oxygenase (mycobilin-producing)
MSDSEAGPVTLINVFEVPAEKVDSFVEKWRERADLMTRAPGFLDAKLHRAMSSESRFQLINVARWSSREAWQAATSNPQFQASLRELRNDTSVDFSANPALYEVVADFGKPSTQVREP